jgi:ATP-dependent helicase/nuclease subunit A
MTSTAAEVLRVTGAASDDDARARIVSDLDTNMLVEAGAGSGKTTSLVERMVALVARGTAVESIAAVTFTRKAANELRERFQIRLEERLRAEIAGSDVALRFDHALRELDRAFLGTIHAFCGRLLHERPLEVALDPNFQEVTEEDWEELKRSFWQRWVERAKRTDDADLATLVKVGVDPRALFAGFDVVSTYPDVDFPTGDARMPEIGPCSRKLTALLVTARELMPAKMPTAGWDALMGLVRRLENDSRHHDWTSHVYFCRAIERIAAAHCKATQNRWSDSRDGKAAAKHLGDEFLALLDGPIADVLRCWREYRYPIVMRVLQRAAIEFERERHAIGQLGFEDLLLLSARLLRENPGARDELGARFAHLLVDEFQDTDPIQAEVCFLLASSSEEGNDWRIVTPRPGSLFVVGDPKQSIYRFRRADIQTYEIVKQRLAACGAVLALTRNFRSVPAIGRVVNEYFSGVFPAEASAVQAAFSPMQTTQIGAPNVDGVFHYFVRPESNKKNAIIELDAAMVGSWIAERVGRGDRAAGDFLVLTFTKDAIGAYARALAERNIAVVTTGARLTQEHELRELIVVLRALADPENAIAVVAALEGLFFGVSPADLFDYGHRNFGITHRPTDEQHVVGRALLVLHEWWMLTQRHPSDVVLDHILDDTGLLYHAASQSLGDARAGALLHLIEALRASSARNSSGIAQAIERVEVMLRSEAADAPLRPGLLDAVRVMNLHKAKGLEAEVVILASPTDSELWDPTIHIDRSDTGEPIGGLVIFPEEGAGGGDPIAIAHPPGWSEMQAKEMEFASAERSRLLYVAVTRAKRELVVARCARTNNSGPVPDRCIWSPLAETLTRLGAAFEPVVTHAPGRRKLDRDPLSIAAATAESKERIQRASLASMRTETVTESAKQQRAEQQAYDLPKGGAGAAWGRAVHRVIEGMGRARTGEGLRAYIRAVGIDEGLGASQCDALLALAEKVSQSTAWKELFADGVPQFELSIMRCVQDENGLLLTEGVIDAAVARRSGWSIVDWKSDAVDDAEWREREEQYARQVAKYAEIISALTGQQVTAGVERVRT